ncbi:putative histidine--tRNA ligase, cytoplasmic [Dictyocoela muelleri]|nr:putative histidine--tRNA ligase, cytoplasmic [Dictyocoela muelleri]
MVELRTPKGTIDFTPPESKKIDHILTTTKQIFKNHGAVSIDTPTFELKEILLNKYGEDSVNIYDLADQGGDICSLRFDLTVSLARYLASRRVKKLKRYQIGKVFRRDQPAITKGRYREFYQCDFDIAGEYLPMLADAEVIKIATECLDKFSLGDYIIKINHRRLLNLFFNLLEIPSESHSTICSTIDKKEKISEQEMRRELAAKCLTNEKIQRLLQMITITGSNEVIDKLNDGFIFKIANQNLGLLDKDTKLVKEMNEIINEFSLLFEYLKIFEISKKVIFDFSLARGAEYYTGIIFEGFYKNHPETGAVVGGGRYDNLVDSLLKGGFSVPCVGFSVGVLRIFSLMTKDVKESDTLVYVISKGDLLLKERLELVNILWKNDIPAETFYSRRNSIQDHKKFISKNQIPITLIIGEEEIKNKSCKILFTGNEENVKRDTLIEYLKDLINANNLK